MRDQLIAAVRGLRHRRGVAVTDRPHADPRHRRQQRDLLGRRRRAAQAAAVSRRRSPRRRLRAEPGAEASHPARRAGAASRSGSARTARFDGPGRQLLREHDRDDRLASRARRGDADVAALLHASSASPPRSAGRRPPAEEIIGGPPSVVISDGFWRSRFNADPAVVGRSLVALRRQPHDRRRHAAVVPLSDRDDGGLGAGADAGDAAAGAPGAVPDRPSDG